MSKRHGRMWVSPPLGQQQRDAGLGKAGHAGKGCDDGLASLSVWEERDTAAVETLGPGPGTVREAADVAGGAQTS